MVVGRSFRGLLGWRVDGVSDTCDVNPERIDGEVVQPLGNPQSDTEHTETLGVSRVVSPRFWNRLLY